MVEFFKCNICGSVLELVLGEEDTVSCCGTAREKLVAHTKANYKEEHIPVVRKITNEHTVTVGSTMHPMTEAHSIKFIYLETDKGGHRRDLNLKNKPECKFLLPLGEKATACYAYCGTHGLWKKEL